MNYQLHYDRLIERARTRSLDGIVERHHVVPKCMGGDDSPDNLVKLTSCEHFVAHQLLVKMYPNETKLVYAMNMMTVSANHIVRNNKRYGWVKKKMYEAQKNIVGEKHHGYGKKRPEHSELMKSKGIIPPSALGIKRSDETKKKISKNNAMKNPEHRKKVSEGLRGRFYSEETRKKLSDSAKLAWNLKRGIA